VFYRKQKASTLVRVLAFDGQWLVLGLVERSQTPAADIEPSSGTTLLNGDFLDVRQPAPFGGALGMAHIVADEWPFSAQVASDWHRTVPLSDIMRAATAG